jgi:hypothetical protein
MRVIGECKRRTSHTSGLKVKASTVVRVVLPIGIIAPLLSGCVTFHALTWGPGPPDLTSIKVGASRESVEQVLGRPARREHNVATYEYNTQTKRTVGGVLTAAVVDASAGLGMLSPLFSGTLRENWEAQRAEVSVVYGPRDTVIGPSHQAADAHYRDWLRETDRKAHLRLLCLAANAGSAPAQATQAARYWYGLWGTQSDRVQALVWARLAAFGGHQSANEMLGAWVPSLTRNEIAEADRTFNDWQPASLEACGNSP